MKDDLVRLFSLHRNHSPSPSLSRGLDALLALHALPNRRHSLSHPETDFHLERLTVSLAAAAGREMDLLPETDWVVVASAFHAAGLFLLLRGRETSTLARTVELMQACADFISFVEERKSRSPSIPPLTGLSYDRMIADTVISLNGWLDDSRLRPSQKLSLGVVLCRAAIFSGCLNWPASGFRFPNLAGALWTHFELERKDLTDAHLLYPTTYTLSALPWRPKPLGEFEFVLSKCLEGPSLSAARALCEEKRVFQKGDFPIGRSMTRFYQRLLGASDAPALRLSVVSELADIALSAAKSSSVHLPGFLNTAFQMRH